MDIFVKYPKPLGYDTHKLLHIIGVILFVGNIIVSAIWMRLAELSADHSVIRFAVKTTDKLDIYMTAPGAFLILINGLILADALAGGSFELGWIRDAVGVFILSALVWIVFLVPLQRKLIVVTREDFDIESVKNLLKRWYLWGILAILLPLSAVYLMVVKP